MQNFSCVRANKGLSDSTAGPPITKLKFLLKNYKYKYKNRKIEVAPDGKSAKVTARRVETITMDRRAAVMISAHLFKDKDMATDEPDVTSKMKNRSP